MIPIELNEKIHEGSDQRLKKTTSVDFYTVELKRVVISTKCCWNLEQSKFTY